MTLCAPWLEAADATLCDSANPDLPRALAVASELLYMASGQQFTGLCTDKVWPCIDGRSAVQWLDYSTGGSRPIAAFGCGCSGNLPSIGWHQAIELPGRPVADVVEILIGGVAFTEYRIIDDQWIVRRDGGAWPCCQHNADLLDGWSVEYRYGLLPKASGILAVEVLACELVAGWCVGAECPPCRLPKRLTQLTYEGASMSTLDPFSFLDDGRFGIAEVDYFVNAFNPDGLRRNAVARSPRDFLTRAHRVR